MFCSCPKGIPKRPRALKFVSVIRRTCSLSNASENVQHPNFSETIYLQGVCVRRDFQPPFHGNALQFWINAARSLVKLPL